MKAIFLDVDGVLYRYFEDRFDFDFKTVNNLVKLCKKSKARVVISSTWRHNPDLLIKLMNHLRDFDEFWNIRVIGATPDLSYDETLDQKELRGCEIHKWIAQHDSQNSDKIENYCIIDDDSDFFLSQKDHHVLTNIHHGFDHAALARAMEILKD